MEKVWQDIYPNQFDCLWTRFQGYKDKRIDEITSYHDQFRPYLVLFYKDGYYYSLPLTSKCNNKSFNIRNSFIHPNELYKVKREDFISRRFILNEKEQDKLINYIISSYWNNILLWSDEEYATFLKTLNKPHIGDYIKTINGLYVFLNSSSKYYLVSTITYPYELRLISNRSFLRSYRGDKSLYNEIVLKKNLSRYEDFLYNAYLFKYNGSRVISLYKEEDNLYCLNLVTRKIFKIDYLTIYTFNHYYYLNTYEKYKFLKKENIHLDTIRDLLTTLEDKLMIDNKKLQLKKG